MAKGQRKTIKVVPKVGVTADVVSFGVVMDAAGRVAAGNKGLVLTRSSLNRAQPALRHCLPLEPLGIGGGDQEPHAAGAFVVYPLWQAGEDRPVKIIAARLGRTTWRDGRATHWASLVHALVIDARDYERAAPQLLGCLANALDLEPVTNAVSDKLRLALPPLELALDGAPALPKPAKTRAANLAASLREGRMVTRAGRSDEAACLGEMAAALDLLPEQVRATIAFGIGVPRACAGLDVVFDVVDGRSEPADMKTRFAAPWRGKGMASLASETGDFFQRVRSERRLALGDADDTSPSERRSRAKAKTPILSPEDVEKLLADRWRLSNLAEEVDRGDVDARDRVLVSAIVARHAAPDRPHLASRLLAAVAPTDKRRDTFALARLDDVPLLRFALTEVERLGRTGNKSIPAWIASASDKIGQAITRAAPLRGELPSRRKQRA